MKATWFTIALQHHSAILDNNIILRQCCFVFNKIMLNYSTATINNSSYIGLSLPVASSLSCYSLLVYMNSYTLKDGAPAYPYIIPYTTLHGHFSEA